MIHETLTQTQLTYAAGGLALLVGGVLLAYRYRQSPPDPEQAGESAGDGAASAVLGAIRYGVRFVNGLFAGLAMAITRFVPKSESIWRGMFKRGLTGMYKTAGGNPDAIGFIHRENGQLDPVPVKWKRGDPEDPLEPPKWVTKGGEEWHPGTEGRETERIGTVPVALFDEDSPIKGSFLQSRFQQALDLGQKDKLFVPETVEQIIVSVDGELASEGGPQAVADGGAVQSQTVYEIPDHEWPDKLADVLVDLSSPGENGGMRVSAKQAKEAFQEKVGSEEMQMQELRGRAAEADPNKQKEMVMLALKAVLAGVLLARSPELLAMLMGSGVGDAMGDAVPSFTILPPVWDLFMVVPL